MKSKPTVSIIMPSYNCTNFIEESVNSVLQQTFTKWELLIVDDCSTDDSIDKLRNFLKDTRIKLITCQENIGAAAARNKAIEKSTGRYIAFLDSDDLWAPQKLEKQIQFMKKNNYAFSFCGYTTITEKGEKLHYIAPPSKITYKQMLKHNYIGCLTAIYDTKHFGKIYMPLLRKRQDFALWLLMLKKVDYAYAIKDNLAFYRIRKESISSNKLHAIKYYWNILRNVGECSIPSSLVNIFCYVSIVTIKKKTPKLYKKIFIK